MVVNEYGTAALCDFGLSMFFRETAPDAVAAKPPLGMLGSTVSSGFTATTRGGTVRYLAPELFDDDHLTLATDVFAFASTCGEVSQWLSTM